MNLFLVPYMGENLLPHDNCFFFFFLYVVNYFRCCLVYVPKLYLHEVVVKSTYIVSSSNPTYEISLGISLMPKYCLRGVESSGECSRENIRYFCLYY